MSGAYNPEFTFQRGGPVDKLSAAEIKVLNAVQSGIGGHPHMIAGARALSHFGEHALGWIAISGIGAAVDAPRRKRWLGVGAAAVAAHGASIIIKRIVRRPRPDHPLVAVNVGTPSKLSFPSSHASSTTAATVLISQITGVPVAAAVVPPMLISRMVLGVHYPSDVLTGAALGAVTAAAVNRALGTPNE